MERRIVVERSAVLLCLALLAAAPAAAQQRMYKCVDAKGKVYYTQLPPRECLGRETQELSGSARVIKRIEPPPTAAERAKLEAQREAENKRKQEADLKAKEQERLNTALLSTYSSEKDIEEARARALRDNEAAMRETQRRIDAALKRQKELGAENAAKAPKLAQDIQDNELELRTQRTSLESRKKQIDAINAKYDEDKRRYIELTRGNAPAGRTVPASAKK